MCLLSACTELLIHVCASRHREMFSNTLYVNSLNLDAESFNGYMCHILFITACQHRSTAIVFSLKLRYCSCKILSVFSFLLEDFCDVHKLNGFITSQNQA